MELTKFEIDNLIKDNILLKKRVKELKADKEALTKQLSLYGVSHQREQLETVIKELDLQVGTNYCADENLIDTLMSSF